MSLYCPKTYFTARRKLTILSPGQPLKSHYTETKPQSIH